MKSIKIILSLALIVGFQSTIKPIVTSKDTVINQLFALQSRYHSKPITVARVSGIKLKYPSSKVSRYAQSNSFVHGVGLLQNNTHRDTILLREYLAIKAGDFFEAAKKPVGEVLKGISAIGATIMAFVLF